MLNFSLVNSLSNSPTIVVPSPKFVASKHICVATIPVSIKPYFLENSLSFSSSSFSYDITIIVDIILNNKAINNYMTDINSDETIDIADITALVDIILGNK